MSSVKRLYVIGPLKHIDRVSSLLFPFSVNQSDAVQQIIRTTEFRLSRFLRLRDERNLEGVRSATWIPGWEHPLQPSLGRAITPDKPTTSPLTTLIDEFVSAGGTHSAQWSLVT